MVRNDCIQIVSSNCQGLNSKEKRRDVFNYLKTKGCNIYCLQDTHFTNNDEPFIKNLWGGECIFNSYSSNQRGVAILFNNNFEYKIYRTKKDNEGNLLGIDVEIEAKRLTLITLYGPNNDSPNFYTKVNEIIEDFNNETVIINGDFNLVLNQELDTFNYQNVNNPRAKSKVSEMRELYNPTDPFRELYPELKRFT